MFVVDAGEGFTCNFVDFVKVVDVGGRVIFTTVAVASGVEWYEHFTVFGVANIDAAVRGIESAVAGLAGRGDTVESVATIFSADEKIARLGAHAEEMAWFVLGKNLIGEFDDIGGFFGFGSIE